MSTLREGIERLVRSAEADRRTGDVLWRVRSDDGSLDVVVGDPHRPFFVASATKLFVTAILAQLRDEGRLDWDATVAGLLPDLDLDRLLVVDGVDRTPGITVRALMAHTSGLPDYFEGKRPDGPTTFERAIHDDTGWTLADVLATTRGQRPHAIGTGHYSDTGYQLLGAVIERLDATTFAESVRARVTAPLGLTGTFCFTTDDLDRYDAIAPLRNDRQVLRLPRAMASVQADGGIVSTLSDAQVFLDAFRGGRLFPRALLDEVATGWHRIFFPLEYGTGVMRFRLPRVMGGLRRVPPFVGHSGASGTVVFHNADLGVSVVGTVNQTAHRSLPYRLMVRTAMVAGRTG